MPKLIALDADAVVTELDRRGEPQTCQGAVATLITGDAIGTVVLELSLDDDRTFRIVMAAPDVAAHARDEVAA